MKKEGTIRVTPRISVCGGLDWKKLLVFEEWEIECLLKSVTQYRK
jgi:hypothetical protein